jgi:endo-1,4-beta-xylanase
MISRREALTLIGASAAAALAPSALANAAAPTPLKTLASAKGLRLGSAMGMIGDERRRQRFYDPAYRALVARECNMIVAENETKWQALQPTPGPYRFAAADEMFAWARKEHMFIRGHTMLWQSPKWLPAWVNQSDFGAQPAQRAEALLREHIKTVCGHLGGDVISYDVINEAVAPQDGALIQNVLSRHLGALEQIDLAFRFTHDYAPAAQLVYNDYMTPGQHSATHRAGVLKLLAGLKARGTPVTALGLQSHIGMGDELSASARGRDNLREWRKFLDEVVAMGYGLLITELDVSDKGMVADFGTRDADTAALARDYLDVTLSYPGCKDLLLWGMADHVNWLQDWDEAKRPDHLPQRPSPYDSRLRAKPMRESIVQALRTMPVRAA